MKAKITEFEKLLATRIQEIKDLKENHAKEIDDLKRGEKMKQDVLKTYARTKEQEIRDTKELLEQKSKQFNAEELRRQKRDSDFTKLTEEHNRLMMRYTSLQQGYDREMSAREKLEQSMLEQERNIRTELQRNDQFHRKKFQELGEKQADTLHKLNFEMAAREDAEMALIHKQEEIFELRARIASVQDSKD